MNQFRIDDNVVVITGGTGFLGMQHAEAVLDGGGIPILLDINQESLVKKMKMLQSSYSLPVGGYICDITQKGAVEKVCEEILTDYGRIDQLINNAANDPKPSGVTNNEWTRFEQFPLEIWNYDIMVSLTGSFLCSQVFGSHMAKQKRGVILNISSDLGLIAPDQRIYMQEGLEDDEQPVKPVTYSVVKHGIIGLTRYLATYWAHASLRVNALCPGGIYNSQPECFVWKLEELIPMGRMAHYGEYKATVLYLLSNASSYMTGAVITVDGGRTCW